jgi:hypothetical protein
MSTTPVVQQSPNYAAIPINPGNIIPLTAAPNQSLVINPMVDGTPITLTLVLDFNEMAQYWVMAIFDVTGDLLLSSIPLITGSYPAANILGQYGYMGIGAAYIINASNSTLDYPNNTDLGTDFILIWGDTAP